MESHCAVADDQTEIEALERCLEETRALSSALAAALAASDFVECRCIRHGLVVHRFLAGDPPDSWVVPDAVGHAEMEGGFAS